MSWLGFVDLALRNAAVLLVVKVTIVLSLASVAAVAAQRSSAARRHALWFGALSSCLWLVLSSPVMPVIAVQSPIPAQRTVREAAHQSATVASRSNRTTPIATPRASTDRSTVSARRLSVPILPLRGRPFIALWITGAVVLLLRHAIGLVCTVRLARRACIAVDSETARELAGAAAVVGVRRQIRVAYSAAVRSPVTFDAAIPYVVFPTDARSWSSERRRAVLVHEAAHIARWDWLSQAIGQLACELFWFHPLAWRAFVHLRNEAERAADDAVLRSGMPPLTYAEHLLELARRTTNTHRELVAIGIVSINDLEQRFVAMLDAKRCRTSVTARGRAVTASVALAVMCPLASLRLVAPEARLPHADSSRVRVQPPARASHTAVMENDSTRVSPALEAHAIASSEPASATSVPSAIAADPAPIPVVRPDLSGRWIADFAAYDFATDWTVAQSPDSISFEVRGHQADSRRISSLHNITFDGAQSRGVVQIGDLGFGVVESAKWAGDTLVLTSYGMVAAGGKINDILTVERMTISADGNTLFDTALSMVNGRESGGLQTLELRRAAR